jgi:hypothetical protein
MVFKRTHVTLELILVSCFILQMRPPYLGETHTFLVLRVRRTCFKTPKQKGLHASIKPAG